jgi:hypothetical protein
MSAVNRWLQAVGSEPPRKPDRSDGYLKTQHAAKSKSTGDGRRSPVNNNNASSKSPSFPHRHRAQSAADASPTYMRRASTSVIEGVTYTPMRSIVAKEVDITIEKVC